MSIYSIYPIDVIEVSFCSDAHQATRAVLNPPIHVCPNHNDSIQVALASQINLDEKSYEYAKSDIKYHRYADLNILKRFAVENVVLTISLLIDAAGRCERQHLEYKGSIDGKEFTWNQ